MNININVKFVLLIGSLILLGCSSPPELSKRYKQGMQNESSGINPEMSESSQYGQFRIFDPNYDFVNNSKDTAASLLQKMPIRNDSQSQVANLKMEDLLPSRYQIISQAQKSIRIQYFTFWGDESGWEIANKLIELKNKGIDIKIIVDAYSNLYPNSQTMFFKLKQNGIAILGYEVAYMYALNMLSVNDDIDQVMDKMNRRFHEKMLIVDAEIPDRSFAIIGGANIGNKYFRLEGGLNNWQDKDVILKGPIVQDIARAFDNNFFEIQEYRENQALLNTDKIWNIALFVRDILKLPPIFNPTPKLNSALVSAVKNRIVQQVNFQWHKGIMRYLYSKPHKDETYITAAYLDFINSAKTEILISNSYFIPTTEIREALKNAAKRGVSVKILSNAKEVTDNPLASVAARMLYPDFLKVNNQINNGGIQIFEWQGHAILHNNEGLRHAKYAVFDKKAVIVGSYNIDPRSRHINTESAIAIESAELANELAQEFEEYITPKYSKNISLQEALNFSDPQDLLGQLEKDFAENLKPML